MLLRGNVFSQTLEMETGITLVTPTNLRTDSPYKVAYLLHGLCGRSGDWADYTMLPTYANDYRTIFIMPEAARSFYTDMKYGLRYFTYISDELPDICKNVFNISVKREDTAIMGASMGGYGALKCALSKPEQYGYCCAFSSACLFLKEYLARQQMYGNTKEFRQANGEQLVKDFEAVFGEALEWTAKDDILDLAKMANEQIIKPKLYCTCGTLDTFHEDNLRFRNEMKKLNFDFTYEDWPGKHNWYFFDESLKKAIKFCFGV